jgi:hypothetical protein
MPEFLAETYAPRDPPGTGTAARRAAQAALAADHTSRPGAQVRLLGAIVVPKEETCFYLYQAPSAGAVRAAVTRAGLRPDRITQAAWIRPPRRTPGRRRAPGRTVTSPAAAAASRPPAAGHGP